MKSKRLISVLVCLALVAAAFGAAGAPNFATVNKAVVSYTALQPNLQAVAAVVLEIDPGFHSQSNKPTGDVFKAPTPEAIEQNKDPVRFTASLDANPAITAFPPVYPEGKSEKFQFDPLNLNVYEGKITVYIPFQVKADAKPGPIKISGTLNYQVCDDKQCYIPTSIPFTVETSIVAVDQAVQLQSGDMFKDFDPTTYWAKTVPITEQKPVVAGTQQLLGGIELKKDSYFLAYLMAFLAGIIFNAVPCVLPVLPLKAIGFYEVSQHNRGKSIAFGAVFSLGLIASFAALAMVIVVYKAVSWGEIYSYAAFNIAIVSILLIMAIGTFGFFNVNLPTGIYNITPRHDTYFGNFLFGILTAVLSTPCTFGLFVGLLAWAVSQPSIIGVTLVMTVGAGMASPYFVLSAFPELARRFPRSGPWSELVKQLMAFLLLGSAVYFAKRFIQPFIGANGFWWTLFGVALVCGLFLFIRTLQLGKTMKAPIVGFVLAAALIGGTFAMVYKFVHQPYEWTAYSTTALEAAHKEKRVAVVEFSAAWCTTCQFLEINTLHEPIVVSTVKNKNVEMLKADVTAKDAPGWKLLKEVNSDGVAAIPYTLVYGPGVTVPVRLPGIYSSQDLTNAIAKAGAK